MSKSERIFHKIIDENPDAIEGQMFGAPCIKAANGKVAAILWQESMIFKLDEKTQNEALKLQGSKQATHLYDSNKPMSGWITIPEKHADQWKIFTKKAIKFVSSLEK